MKSEEMRSPLDFIPFSNLPLLALTFSVVWGISPFSFHVGNYPHQSFKGLYSDYALIRGKYFLRGDSKSDLKGDTSNPPGSSQSQASLTSPAWFLQCVNHFPASSSLESNTPHVTMCPDSKHWHQRYWINWKFYDADGPIFFMFGGEGNAKGFVDGGKWLDYAEEYDALVVCLEHRFYGSSFPTSDCSSESMKLLTSRQALADAAKFITWLKQEHPFPYDLKDTKVVAFGGSYAGNLAAWMRQDYPNIVDMAVASSAPLEAKVRFPEFYQTIAKVIESVDGKCHHEVSKTFRCLHHLINESDSDLSHTNCNYSSKGEMFRKLRQCRLFDFSVEWQKQHFFHIVGGVWGTNYPGHSGVEKCEMLLSQGTTDVIQSYGGFLADMNRVPESCNDDAEETSPQIISLFEDGDDTIKFLKSGKGEVRDAKSWIWQTCYEFGYFQVASETFANGWDTEIDIKRCQGVYPHNNFTEESVQRRVDETNNHYKGKAYKGTCTIFTNGEWDPWHTLGITRKNETNSKNTIIFIPEGEHCEDMRGTNPAVHVYKAQLEIQAKIGEYLNDPTC